MLTVSNLSLQYGKRVLFDEVNIKFTKGNCYGVIGANGAGKSTFLRILSGEETPNSGTVHLERGKRMSVLKQDHFAYNDCEILQTVVMGNQMLFGVKKEMDEIYAKPDFSDEDGIKAGELSLQYEEMGGWTAESDASYLLSSLGVSEQLHFTKMSGVDGNTRVRVLLAQAIFGNPDVLILDEPTNDLDIETVVWLENFLADFENTVIVVSHDRHFLDTVCTTIADIDFGKINLFTGNYTFWYESSQLAFRQREQANKKAEEKRKELQSFIDRFSANAAKSKQATSRKKLLDKLNIEDIKPSSRRYPAIIFEQEREAGDQILSVENLSKSLDGKILFKDVEFKLNKGDKVALISKNSMATTALYQIINENMQADSGTFNWGITTTHAYLPLDNSEFFKNELNLVDWLRQYAKDNEVGEIFIRGFLGKMLFSGDEALKQSNVLSGGEKVRCMLSKMMLLKANVLTIDEPTSHLDLESITAFNNSLKTYKGTVLFTSHDHEFLQTVADRVIEITPNGVIDKQRTYDEYINAPQIKELRDKMYI